MRELGRFRLRLRELDDSVLGCRDWGARRLQAGTEHVGPEFDTTP